MQKLHRSLQSFIQNTLELKSESSKDKALHALGKFEKFSKIYHQKSADNLVDEIIGLILGAIWSVVIAVIVIVYGSSLA